ncbi:UDP-4-amino-4,6-dideoxy-N-acetyl-beta-L-altrosamine transaminase [Thalassotalea montiporae]
MIPYGKQHITEQDISAVVEVLKSDFITQGPKVLEFEQAIAQYCHAQHAVATNSATSALHIACQALGLSQGDYLWTSPISFVASANCGRYCGAQVDFVDIDLDTVNICPKKLKEKLVLAKQQNKLPKVVVVVHMAGLSCDMQAIATLAKEYEFTIIEDASHAIGGQYHGKPVGNCQFSDISVFSFHPVKIITSAEGGIAVTNDKALASKMRLYSSHGVTREQATFTNGIDAPWYYEQHCLGQNYRMTELQGALGLSQLQRVDNIIEQRQQLAKRYQTALTGLPIQWQQPVDDNYSAYHLFVIRLNDDAKLTREQLFEALREANIGVNVHYIPIHTQPYYRELGFNQGDFPVAEHYYQGALSLPLYPELSEQDFDHITTTLHTLLG